MPQQKYGYVLVPQSPTKIANKKSNYAILSCQIISVMVRSATILSIHATMNDDFLDDNVRNMYHGWVGKGFHPNSPSGGGGPGFFMPAEQFGIRLMRPDSLPHPYSPAGAALTPNQIKQRVAEPEPIKLTDLPSVMRKKGWPVGAAVMEKWLTGSMRKMTKDEKTGDIPADKYPLEFIDTKLITWKWLSNFEIVRDGRATLITRLTANNEKTLKELRNKMKIRTSTRNNAASPILDEILMIDLSVRNLKDNTGADLGNLMIPGLLNKNRLKELIMAATNNILAKTAPAIKNTANLKNGQKNKSISREELANLSTIAGKSELELADAKKQKVKYEALVDLFEELTINDFVERTRIKQIKGDLTYASYSVEFKNKVEPILLHSYWQFQLATVKRTKAEDYFRGNTNGLDDLDAALHAFGLYAAILAGRITDYGIGKAFSTTISKIGIYMRDTYDFIDEKPSDSQYLAHWGYNDVTVNASGQEKIYKSWNGDYMWPIHNSDYIQYQDKNKRGGDLMLFSDIEVISSKISFTW